MRGRRIQRLRGLALILAATLTACGLPADPQGTLVEARGNELHIGVVHDPPWTVVERGEVVGGVEVQLMREFADRIDAEPVFHPGHLNDLAEALAEFELDVLVGGLTTDSPWGGRLAFAPTYYTERIVVAGRQTRWVDDLDGAVVAYPDDEPQLAERIRTSQGTPVAVPAHSPQALADHHELVAVPGWRTEQLGLHPSGVRLAERNRVIALPPGENSLLLELTRYLRGQAPSVETLLDEEVAE